MTISAFIRVTVSSLATVQCVYISITVLYCACQVVLYSATDIAMTLVILYAGDTWACWHDHNNWHDRSDLKVGTAVVLITMLKPTDFRFQRSQLGS